MYIFHVLYLGLAAQNRKFASIPKDLSRRVIKKAGQYC